MHPLLQTNEYWHCYMTILREKILYRVSYKYSTNISCIISLNNLSRSKLQNITENSLNIKQKLASGIILHIAIQVWP